MRATGASVYVWCRGWSIVICYFAMTTMAVAATTTTMPSKPRTVTSQAHHTTTSGLTLSARWSGIQAHHAGLHLKPAYRDYFPAGPAQRKQFYPQQQLRVFVPPPGTRVGQSWHLRRARILPFLRQLHRGATLTMHNGGAEEEGAFAILRAQSSAYQEIALRIHAEFTLKPETLWYTPGQFAGRVLIDRRTKRVISLRLFLPDRNPNVDLNAGRGIDAVYVKHLELKSHDQPVRWPIAKAMTISWKEARERLLKKAYRYAAAGYLPIRQAIAKARREGKLLHVIVLFGALDDQSC